MPGYNRQHQHAFLDWHPSGGLVHGVISRRQVLQGSLAGLAGLTLPGLVAARQQVASPAHAQSGKSVILLWLAGGPSHIDMWDPKPDRPAENRGPFSVISTAIPGTYLCEHMPKQAALLDRMTIIRSVDARLSSHAPNKVFQTGKPSAFARTDSQPDINPAIGSIVAKFHGSNHPAMPSYAACIKSPSHVAMGEYLGRQFDPFPILEAADLPQVDNVGKPITKRKSAALLTPHPKLNATRLNERQTLLHALDRLRGDLDDGGSMQALGQYGQQAVELVSGGRARAAFDLRQEPQEIRQNYGPHVWCQQALLARRLVEAGVTFVTIDLSYHPASGTWDTHGDNIPPYGGISKGLRPLLPIFDHLWATLITDLEVRGLLDDVLVIAMGEFGRTPKMGTQASTDGRDHWPNVMSMVLAGGGLRHGQVIGESEQDGGGIKSRPVTPGDLAATLYAYFGIPLETMIEDARGRPVSIVENGRPIAELLG